MIDSFSGEYRFLSNFYPSTLVWDGRIWKTSEHAYQAAKSLDEVDRILVHTCDTPGQAKRMGRKITLRPDWKQVKLNIMREIIIAKFEQNDDLCQKLIDTGEQELVEGNTWGDTFWGVCRGRGQNHLGKILMAYRSIAQYNQTVDGS